MNYDREIPEHVETYLDAIYTIAENSNPRYPNIEVRLIGRDSSAGAIMSTVSTALKSHGVPEKEINEFRVSCFSGDYNDLLRTCMSLVTVI